MDSAMLRDKLRALFLTTDNELYISINWHLGQFRWETSNGKILLRFQFSGFEYDYFMSPSEKLNRVLRSYAIKVPASCKSWHQSSKAQYRPVLFHITNEPRHSIDGKSYNRIYYVMAPNKIMSTRFPITFQEYKIRACDPPSIGASPL